MSSTKLIKSHWRTIFDVGSTAVMLVLAAAVVWQGRALLSPAQPARESVAVVPEEPIVIGRAPVRGSLTASVAIVEFADFECPACARFTEDVEPVLRSEYVDAGRVALIFKHFPLSIHATATEAARAAWCANEQGRFWEAHDWLYAMNPLETLTAGVDVDSTALGMCRQGDGALAAVEADVAEAERLQVRGTPTFFIGSLTPDGRVEVTDAVLGVQTIEYFRSVLNRLLD